VWFSFLFRVISWIVSLTGQKTIHEMTRKETKDKYTKEEKSEIGNRSWLNTKKDLS
jgi:hypothetical protein